MWDAEWELLIFSINSSVWEIVEGVTAFHIERWGDKPKYARFFVAIFREVEVRGWTDFEFGEKNSWQRNLFFLRETTLVEKKEFFTFGSTS